jgi:hypothetical protein
MGWLVPLVAAPTLGLIFVPSGAWVGNERGVDVRARWSVAKGADEIMVGLAPVFRVALEESAIRLPAIVNYVAPELGFSTRSGGGPAGYVAWNIFPFALRLGPHAAIDLEPLLGIRVPGDGAGATLIASMSVAIALRRAFGVTARFGDAKAAWEKLTNVRPMRVVAAGGPLPIVSDWDPAGRFDRPSNGLRPRAQ